MVVHGMLTCHNSSPLVEFSDNSHVGFHEPCFSGNRDKKEHHQHNVQSVSCHLTELLEKIDSGLGVKKSDRFGREKEIEQIYQISYRQQIIVELARKPFIKHQGR